MKLSKRAPQKKANVANMLGSLHKEGLYGRVFFGGYPFVVLKDIKRRTTILEIL